MEIKEKMPSQATNDEIAVRRRYIGGSDHLPYAEMERPPSLRQLF